MLDDPQNAELHHEWDRLDLDAMRRRKSYKWSPYVGEDVVAAWVADMDLPASVAIASGVRRFYEQGDLGYFDETIYQEVRATAVARFAREYSWQVQPHEIELVGDIVQSLHLVVQHYSHPGDRVALVTPVYHHFYNAIIENGRVPAPIALDRTDTGYHLDLELLEHTLAQERTNVLLLCHPHNPTGTVLGSTELRAVAEIAARHGVIIVSDEIHADLTYEIETFVPLAVAAAETGCSIVTLTSAGKAFNIAGTHLGMMIYNDAQLRSIAPRFPTRANGKPGLAGCVATHIAWSTEQGWLLAARSYLQRNRDYLIDAIEEHLPELQVFRPDATYLAWIDFSAVTPAAHAFLREQAGIISSNGTDFSWPRGTGAEFARLNFATSFPVVEAMTERLIDACSQGRKN